MSPMARTYIIVDIYCSDISIEDVRCICCGEPLDKVSTFKKNHAGCLERMKDGLPRHVIAKAIKQRDRIFEAPNKLLDVAFRTVGNEGQNPNKRGQNSGYEELSTPQPKIKRVDDRDAGSKPRAQDDTEIETSPAGVCIHSSCSLATC